MSDEAIGHTVIRASAGSGKTWRLGNRYIALLAKNVPPENIVAAIFSRKVAGEILERILTRLVRAIVYEKPVVTDTVMRPTRGGSIAS